MNQPHGLLILDRDGVLNPIVVDAEHGTIDSPLHVAQAEIFEFVPEALRMITRAGYGIAIATNQPSAAKGKTTQANLIAVHERILAKSQSSGGVILSSHICFHRSEDGCACRKPKTGLLEEAFARNLGFDKSSSWMAGDGVTDIQAGVNYGLKTAFFGPHKCDACKVFDSTHLKPVFWGDNLLDFARFLTST